MAKVMDLHAVVKHIVNGSFEDSLCRVCLLPLGERYEDIFTRVIKEGKEYCIADVLDDICHIKLKYSENQKVCSDCFFEASSAYRFYLLSKRTEEILSYYVNELQKHISSVNFPEVCSTDSVCIKLPLYAPQTQVFNYDLSGLCLENNDKQFKDIYGGEGATSKLDKSISTEVKNSNLETSLTSERYIEAEQLKTNENDSDIVIIMSENGEPSFYTSNNDGSLVALDPDDVKPHCAKFLQSDFEIPNNTDSPPHDVNGKKRRRRSKMDYKKCSQCPIKYRFVAKLKEHMKTDHNIDIFVCKVCKAIIENEDEFNSHLKTHTDVHRCSICNAVFKKRETIIAHFRSHEAMKELSKAKSARVCEICGWILKDEASLKDHHQDKHVKKYTCYYCGRMYKGEISFDVHIKKHEAHLNSKQKRNLILKKEAPKEKHTKRRHECTICSKSFVDERSLMWHQRLHTDERPYICEVCGRGFVSVNRRNQHALCAHTAPARRCPLCPALFHLRSMVNSHIKKVHLQTHKRRNRTSKHQNVFWRTEPVPFQDLSVAVQNDILELKTNQARRFSVFKQEEQFLDSYCTVKVQPSDNQEAHTQV